MAPNRPYHTKSRFAEIVKDLHESSILDFGLRESAAQPKRTSEESLARVVEQSQQLGWYPNPDNNVNSGSTEDGPPLVSATIFPSKGGIGSSKQTEQPDWLAGGTSLPSLVDSGPQRQPQSHHPQRAPQHRKKVGVRPPVHGATGVGEDYPSTNHDRTSPKTQRTSSRTQYEASQNYNSRLRYFDQDAGGVYRPDSEQTAEHYGNTSRSNYFMAREADAFKKPIETLAGNYPTLNTKDLSSFLSARQFFKSLEASAAEFIPAKENFDNHFEEILESNVPDDSAEASYNFWKPIDTTFSDTQREEKTTWQRRENSSSTAKYVVSLTLQERSPDFMKYIMDADRVRRLNSVGCENVPKVYTWKSIGAGRKRIIYEHCLHNDLWDLVDFYKQNSLFIPESFIWHVFHSLVKALCYCEKGTLGPSHKVGWDSIVHLNIRPETVFMSDMIPNDSVFYPSIKLANFGGGRTIPEDAEQAEAVREYQSTKYWGNSVEYMPPEQVLSMQTSHKGLYNLDPIVGSPSDVFSLGATMKAIFLSGLSTYFPEWKEILETAYDAGDRQTWGHYKYPNSNEIAELINDCLHEDPLKRISLQTLLERTGRRNEQHKVKLANAPLQRYGVHKGMVLYSQALRDRYRDDASFCKAFNTHSASRSIKEEDVDFFKARVHRALPPNPHPPPNKPLPPVPQPSKPFKQEHPERLYRERVPSPPSPVSPLNSLYSQHDSSVSPVSPIWTQAPNLLGQTTPRQPSTRRGNARPELKSQNTRAQTTQKQQASTHLDSDDDSDDDPFHRGPRSMAANLRRVQRVQPRRSAKRTSPRTADNATFVPRPAAEERPIRRPQSTRDRTGRRTSGRQGDQGGTLSRIRRAFTGGM